MSQHKQAPKPGQTQQPKQTIKADSKSTTRKRQRRPLENYMDPEYIWENKLAEEKEDEALPEIPDDTEEEDNPVLLTGSGENESPSLFQPATPHLRQRYKPLWLWTGEFLIWATDRPGVNPIETETLRSGLEKLIGALHSEGLAKDFDILRGFIHRDWIDLPEPVEKVTSSRKRTGKVPWLNRLDRRTIVDLETGNQIPVGSLFADEGLRKGDIPDRFRRHWLAKTILQSQYPDSEELKWSRLGQWLPHEVEEFFSRLNEHVRAAFPHVEDKPFKCPKKSTLQRKWIPDLRKQRKDEKES